jgi:hypothetical protein
MRGRSGGTRELRSDMLEMEHTSNAISSRKAHSAFGTASILHFQREKNISQTMVQRNISPQVGRIAALFLLYF